jgi:hypothetical protein
LGGASILAGAGLMYNSFVTPENRLGAEAIRHSPVIFLGPLLIAVGLLIVSPALRARHRVLLWIGTSLFVVIGLLFLSEVVFGSEVAGFFVSLSLFYFGLPALVLVGFGLWKRYRQAEGQGR